MPKKKSWFHRLRDYFVVATDNKQQQGKKKKRSKRRWVFKWMRTKRPPSLVAPTSSSSSSKEEQPRNSSSGLKIKIRYNSTTGSSTPHCTSQITKQVVASDDPPGVVADSPCSKNHRSEEQNGNNKNEVNNGPQLGSRRRHSNGIGRVKVRAATIIQTAFRGYLARKALKALKGLVRLQAIIRGRAVRRQAAATLKCLESIVNIQSQVCATRYQIAQEKIHHHHRKEIHGDSPAAYFNSKYDHQLKKVETVNSRRHRRDNSLFTEEENFVTEVANSRRERMMAAAYMFSGRHSAEYEDGRASQRLRNWVERYISDNEQQLPQMEEEIKRVDTIGGKPHHLHHHHQQQHPELITSRNTQQKPQCIHGPDTPALMHPRRSSLLQKKHQRSTTFEHRSIDPSLTMPTYMAATESAKAKVRLTTTTSTPSPARKQLRRVQSDACSDGDYSPYKYRFSPASSINSERTWSGTKVGWTQNNQLRSYCHGLKGCNSVDPGYSLRSSTGSSNSKDLGFDQFQTWALNWN